MEVYSELECLLVILHIYTYVNVRFSLDFREIYTHGGSLRISVFRVLSGYSSHTVIWDFH